MDCRIIRMSYSHWWLQEMRCVQCSSSQHRACVSDTKKAEFIFFYLKKRFPKMKCISPPPHTALIGDAQQVVSTGSDLYYTENDYIRPITNSADLATSAKIILNGLRNTGLQTRCSDVVVLLVLATIFEVCHDD